MNAEQMINMTKKVLKQINPKLARKIEQNPQVINKALKAAGAFSQDKNGAIKAITAYGGMQMFDKASNMVKKYPIANFTLKGLGIDIDDIKRDLSGNKSQLSNNYIDVEVEHVQNISPMILNSYKDRLNRLR